MDDNARPHRTLAVEELLESEDITRMDWPAYSPDLNPIEYVWDALRRRIASRLHHPENTQQLKQRLIKEWALLPQEMLHQLVLSMRRRCEATIAEEFIALGNDIVCLAPVMADKNILEFVQSLINIIDAGSDDENEMNYAVLVLTSSEMRNFLRRGTFLGGQSPPTSLPFPPTSQEDLQLDGYLEYTHTAKALYIYKHPCLLRDSNPGPTAQQSASPTTTQEGRHNGVLGCREKIEERD
ncbi:transposable element Tcb2 transposase [Trichonephila clavipes]|nr:transposable element Tcb2 transposase [Trichonephila clavipes]